MILTLKYIYTAGAVRRDSHASENQAAELGASASPLVPRALQSSSAWCCRSRAQGWAGGGTALRPAEPGCAGKVSAGCLLTFRHL